MENRLLIGCVADDFTGASDAASFLISCGIKTLLFNGIPKGNIEECSAVVIALKSRTQETKSAVDDTIKAFKWLKNNGAEHLYFKYCSTFDSTKNGNIGPVVDAVMEEFNVKYTILCPALPVNKRTVKNGILYVDGIPLSETHMKNHPITPMWHSEISELMKPQGKYDTININYETLKKSKEEILNIINDFGKNREHFYVVPDYSNYEEGEKISEVFGDIEFLTGGSGILEHIGTKYKKTIINEKNNILESKTKGKGIVFAGSCSKATLEQISDFKSKNYKSYKIDPIKLYKGNETIENIWNFVKENNDKEVLIYSSDSSENVAEIQKMGKDNISKILEETIAKLAERAIEEGYTRIVVAGGETSSAVAKKLGYNSFEIGESIAPGVPIMAPLSDMNIRIVLKSGNFGQKDFFERALNCTRK